MHKESKSQTIVVVEFVILYLFDMNITIGSKKMGRCGSGNDRDSKLLTHLLYTL